MEKEALEIAFKNAEDSSVKIIALVGSACTTSTGTYDDLEMLAEFAEAHDLWFHVDGAHGGAAIFSEKYRHLVKGIERSDSVVVDCHKMLMAPSLTTVLLFKQEKSAYQTFHQQAQYLWADNEQREWYNVGKRAFECTKHMMSIRVYSILRTYGPDLFEAFVTRLYDLGQTAAKLIASRPDFELDIRPEANIVCFRYTSNAEENTDLNRLNRAIRQKLLETGDYYIVQTILKGAVYLRLTIMNPFTTEEIFEALLNEIRQIANKSISLF